VVVVPEEVALLWRPLVGAVGDAVPAVVKALDVQADGRLAGDEVVGIGEVLEMRQAADLLRHVADEAVVAEVELLDAVEARELVGDGAHQLVEAEVEHGEAHERAELRRHAGLEPRVHEDDLVERGRHVGDGGREAAAEVVVGEHEHGGRRVAEVVGDLETESVGVDEDGVERSVEELAGHGSLEVVEAQVEVSEAGQAEHDVGEGADEAVVAEVELVERVELVQRPGHEAAEAVGVEVENGEVSEQAQLLREVSGEVGVVEVDGGDDGEVGVLRRGRAVDAGVGAHVGARPRARHVVRVGEDGAPPRLQRHVRVAEARVRERVGRVDDHAAAIAGAAAVVLQQLAPPDVGGVGRAEAAASKRRRCGEEVRREQEEDKEDGEGRVARWRRHRGARIGSGAEWNGKKHRKGSGYMISRPRGIEGGARE
jgi:hypothetical protein